MTIAYDNPTIRLVVCDFHSAQPRPRTFYLTFIMPFDRVGGAEEGQKK